MNGWLFDTNVISELARKTPDPKVKAWLGGLPSDRTFISILTLGEIDQRIAALKPADHRRAPYERFRALTEADFVGRILPVDDEVVRLWGALSGCYTLDFGGKAPVVDAMLAATAQHRRLHPRHPERQGRSRAFRLSLQPLERRSRRLPHPMMRRPSCAPSLTGVSRRPVTALAFARVRRSNLE